MTYANIGAEGGRIVLLLASTLMYLKYSEQMIVYSYQLLYNCNILLRKLIALRRLHYIIIAMKKYSIWESFLTNNSLIHLLKLIKIPCVAVNHKNGFLRVLSLCALRYADILYLIYITFRRKRIIIDCDVRVIRYDNVITLIKVICTN